MLAAGHASSRLLRFFRALLGWLPGGLAVIVALLIALCGCASQSSKEAAAELTAKGDRETASHLYAGQPAVVHATEYPVASYPEGIKRGDEAWRQGKLDLAVYLYVQALAFDATQAAPFLKIGTIHEQLGNRALAEKAYELGLERDPGNAVARERLGLLYLQSGRDDDARCCTRSTPGTSTSW